MSDMRATLKSVRGKGGSRDDPRPVFEVVLVVQRTEAAAELLPFIGHDLAVAIDPLDRLLLAQSQTPMDEAIAAPVQGSNGTNHEPAARAPRRRRGTASSEQVATVAEPVADSPDGP